MKIWKVIWYQNHSHQYKIEERRLKSNQIEDLDWETYLERRFVQIRCEEEQPCCETDYWSKGVELIKMQLIPWFLWGLWITTHSFSNSVVFVVSPLHKLGIYKMFRNNWVCVWHNYAVSMFSYSSNETVPHLQKSDIETCGAIELVLVTLTKFVYSINFKICNLFIPLTSKYVEEKSSANYKH